jgi:hypothetical protein
MIFIISFCILVSIGQWKQFNGYANDSRFANIVHHLPSFVQSSKSDSTLKKYKCYFKKFERLCKSSATVSIYIGGLIQQGSSVAILDSSFYASFYFENNLCSNKLLSLILEGGKRLSLILILDNSLYLKNPENHNKNKTQILNLLTSLRSPKTVIIRCKISGVMGSF